jgi:hypothetical protein
MNIGGVVNKAIYVIIGVVLLFSLYSTLMPTAQTAGNTLNASGVPLGSLFTGNGVIFIILMVALLLTILATALPKGKGK